MLTRPALFYRTFQALFCNAHQLQPFFADRADRDRGGRVTNKSIQRCTTIDRKDIAVLKSIVRRKSVHNLLVYRSTNGRRKTVIALKSRKSSRISDHLFGGEVNLTSRHTRGYQVSQLLQHESCQPP